MFSVNVSRPQYSDAYSFAVRSGRIPEDLGKLTALKALLLHDNELAGECVKLIFFGCPNINAYV